MKREDEVARLLTSQHVTLSIAESCTGGAVSASLVAIPGASQYLNGGIVAYSTHSKVDILGVSQKTIDSVGIVSKETVTEMAVGVKKIFHTHYGISLSGLAGPGTGGETLPVGTVWLAIVTPKDRIITKKISSPEHYERRDCIEWTVQEALQLLIDTVVIHG